MTDTTQRHRVVLLPSFRSPENGLDPAGRSSSQPGAIDLVPNEATIPLKRLHRFNCRHVASVTFYARPYQRRRHSIFNRVVDTLTKLGGMRLRRMCSAGRAVGCVIPTVSR